MEKTILRVLQIFMALLLLAAALGKMADLQGYAAALETYRLFPEPFVLPAAAALAIVELVLSLWLFSGAALKYSALAALLLHVIFALVALVSNLRALEIPNCGCFGVFWARPMTWLTVFEDLALVAVCYIIHHLAPRQE